MTEKRFKEIVASYGAEQKRWPEAERESASAFAKHNANAQTIINNAAQTDALLSLMPNPQPADKAFVTRLAAMGPASARQTISLSDILGDILSINLQGFMPRAVGLASVCALGIMLGLSNVARYDDNVIKVDASELMFGTSSLNSELEEIN